MGNSVVVSLLLQTFYIDITNARRVCSIEIKTSNTYMEEE